MLAVQKICLLCPRLFCVVLHGVLVRKDLTREIKNAVARKHVLFKILLTASVPPACTRSRGTLLAAEFQNLYGLNLATAVWISASVDDIPRRLEKLKRTDI
ncbi:hypothetical protein DFJ58DRAFT_798273 [Suillus subalutaceus]|uniref:uncharacterized protein n=1 Tax=Suillus subalutaceus TaxID=48586 RepID=UPI001B86C1EE|nr:uncharacterized protein DFJ58DRAFT_798273 [Suillus subalutaceus]KAG1847164.1 hypothetical protein DFJ58DRAFT_798273 [Suillus subalutaceus]